MTTFDSTLVREYRPDYQMVFSESGHDAWTLCLARQKMFAVLLAGLALLATITWLSGAAGALGAHATSTRQTGALFGLVWAAYWICLAVVSVFAFADSVRTVRPEFRMTVAGVFAIFGFSLLIGIITNLGVLCFIIPGLWLAVKLSQTVYVYFLRPQGSPLEKSWQITTGHFWETLLFYVLIAVFVSVGMLLPFYAAVIASVLFPPAIVIMLPFVFAIWCFMVYFNQLVHVRWSEALLQASELHA